MNTLTRNDDRHARSGLPNPLNRSAAYNLRRTKSKVQQTYHLMMAPGIIFLIIFSFVPMAGIVMAFQDFVPARGVFRSRWVGLSNFEYMFQIPDSYQIFRNTIVIALGKIILETIIPIAFALLLNELRAAWFKKTVQTIVYLPHFLSWAVLATVVVNIFSMDGPVNDLVKVFGHSPIMFMASNQWFRSILIGTDVWKEFGYASIIFLAALTSIDPGLYEAAAIDGAGRFRQMLAITLPGIMPIVMLQTAMGLSNILNAGFDQVFNLYNPIVYQTGDIIDTYVYRTGLINMQYSFATAVGLLKSVVGCILLLSANQLSKKIAHMQIF